MEIQLPRELLDRYPFVRALGVGGMGAVYLGRQVSLARQVVNLYCFGRRGGEQHAVYVALLPAFARAREVRIVLELKVLPFGMDAGRLGVGPFDLLAEGR